VRALTSFQHHLSNDDDQQQQQQQQQQEQKEQQQVIQEQERCVKEEEAAATAAQKEQQQQQQQHKASAFELSSRIELLEAEVSGLDRNLSSKQQARARLGACLDELDNTMTSSSAAAGRANKPCAPFVPHAVLDRAQSGSSSSGSSDGGGSGDEDAQLQVRLDKYANQI
jgi:uncharacterized small protein (DUF1192 family)